MPSEAPDIHDSLMTGYSVDGVNRTLVLHTEPHEGGGSAWINVVFNGVVAYHFEGDCLKNIVFGVEEIPAAQITSDPEFEERSRMYGAPPGWDPRRESAEQFFLREGCRVFEVHCSYGLGGWVAAQSVDRIIVAGPKAQSPKP